MSKKYCMDCGDYREGGICGRNGKPTSALKEMCEDHAGNDVAMAGVKSEKQCVKCGRRLPIESFA